MDIDFSTYAQLSGFSYMPTPEEYYPEMRGGMQQQEQPQQQQQQQCGDYDQRPSPLNNHQPLSAPDYSQYQSQGRGMENMSDGFQSNPYNPGRSYTSASEYRCMAREQRRAKEMNSRNGLYSPFEASARYSGGDASYYPNYADDSRRMESQGRNPYW